MAQAKTDTAALSKPPMKVRFKAWWHGEQIARNTFDGDDDAPVAPAPSPVSVPSDDEGWTEERIRAAGLIFGQGQVDPVSEVFIDEMIRPLGMNDTMSVLEYPAGIGAATRAVARLTGAWITSVEEDPVLAAAAGELSKNAGLAKKAAIVAGALSAANVREGSCDVALSFGGLQDHGDKDELLASMAAALKSSGQLVLTDFVLTGEDAAGPELEAWIAREATAGAPETIADLTARLEALDFNVHIAEDKTAAYAGLARKALRDFWRTPRPATCRPISTPGDRILGPAPGRVGRRQPRPLSHPCALRRQALGDRPINRIPRRHRGGQDRGIRRPGTQGATGFHGERRGRRRAARSPRLAVVGDRILGPAPGRVGRRRLASPSIASMRSAPAGAWRRN